MTEQNATQDQAIEFHGAVAAAAGNEAIRHLFESVGAIKGMDMMRQLNQGLSLSLARQVRDNKDYRLLPGKDGGKCTWEEFCQEHLGVTKRHIDELLATERQLGAGFCAAADRLGVRRAEVRMLLSAPVTIQGDIRTIVENPEGAVDDELRDTIDQLVAQISEQAGVVEDLGETIEARNAEIDKRKKSEAKREDELRAVRRQLREAQAEYVPSEEEEEATNELAIFDAQLRAAHRRICAQIEAMPDSHDVLTIGKGIRDNLVQLADDLGGVLVAAVNNAAGTK